MKDRSPLHTDEEFEFEGQDQFHMLWLPWATHRRVWLKTAVWAATQRRWPVALPANITIETKSSMIFSG